MGRIEAGQTEFIIEPGNTLAQLSVPDKPVSPEKEYRVSSLITFSELEKLISGEREQESDFNFDASMAIGTAIDYLLVPANFAYRYRDDYCFPEELYPEWNIDDVFARFYPTGWYREEILDLLKKHREDFSKSLSPHNIALERGNIKRALIPLWNDVANKFDLGALNLQSTMEAKNGDLLHSGEVASSEEIWQIGQRIVTKRFDALVDDDKNFTSIAKPDCMLVIEIEGQLVHVHVQPDLHERQREKRKTTQKRSIITKRILVDYKDAKRRDLSDYSTSFGKTMLVYKWLLEQIGQRFKQNQLTWVRHANRQFSRFFLIPQEVKNPIDESEVETKLAFLHEEGPQIFTPLPKLTKSSKELAKSIFENTIADSRKSKLQ